MNNGPWGTGMQPGYTAWSARNGQVTFNPQSSFNPQTYQQAYGQPAQQQAPQANPFDFLKGIFQPASDNTATVQNQVQARPVYNRQQMNSALSKYSSMAPAYTDGPLGGTANDLYKQEAGRARVGTGRQFDAANASMLLRSQNARSQAGLGWGRLASQQQALSDGQSLNQTQMGLALLQALGVI